MNNTGRPRNTAGSLYPRRDSRVWWMSYRDQNGRFRQKSTGQSDKGEAEKVMRKRLVARDEGLLPGAAPSGGITFNKWADWFVKNRSKPPFRSEKTHLQNLGALKFLRLRFGKHRLSDITAEEIESYLMNRLNTGKRVHTKLGPQLRGRLKPATVHQKFRILGRILNVAVKKRRLALNPCNGVEFPVALAGTTRKPHHLTASEQERLEACAPVYLRNIIVIMLEMGLRPYRELIPTRKEHVDIENGIVHLPGSKTANGIGDMPMTDLAREEFISQMKESGDSEYLFPSPRAGGKKPHITTVRKLLGPDAEARWAPALFAV
jgi:integrase